MTAPDPTTPNDTPNMIGFQPTESADDVTGLTAQVTAPGALATVVTVVQRTMNSADQVPKVGRADLLASGQRQLHVVRRRRRRLDPVTNKVTLGTSCSPASTSMYSPGPGEVGRGAESEESNVVNGH